MTIDQLLSTAQQEGLFLNNLFQNHKGEWWAEWRTQTAGEAYGFASAIAPTALEALIAARANILLEPEPGLAPIMAADRAILENLCISDEDMDAILGEPRL